MDNAPAPKGAYSQVVRAGDFLYVSDQWPIDPETQSFVVSDIQDETKLTLDNVERVLQGCGASRKNIVKCGVFLAKAEDFAAMNEVYAEEALFNLMVTVFGIFLAPTLLPVLPTLVRRRVTTVGALTGFSLGLASGLTMLLLKTYWQGAVQVAGSIYGFEGIALLSNIAMTLLGLWFGSVIGRRSVDEKARANEFGIKDADSGPRF